MKTEIHKRATPPRHAGPALELLRHCLIFLGDVIVRPLDLPRATHNVANEFPGELAKAFSDLSAVAET